MSDSQLRTQLLDRLFERQIITADQLSRGKLYLQFISHVGFDTEEGAIDWLLENRIISERPTVQSEELQQPQESAAPDVIEA
ncbi:hypothetical protein, partial [Leminorella grimontii]